MVPDDIRLVLEIFDAPTPGAEVDMAAVMQSDEFWEQRRDLVSPGLEVAFITPGSGVQVMDQQEFVGLEGLKEGWRQWLEPWEQFRVLLGEVIDAGHGRVLVCGRATVRIRDTGVEMTQETAVLNRVQGGKVVSMGFYLDQGQARRDAGLADD